MPYDLVCIGTSWGGLQALRAIIGTLPADFPAAVVCVQHRHRESSDALAHLLQDHSALPVREAEDKEPVCPGCIFVAPPDYHLLFDGPHFALSTDPPVRYSRPSIDVTFASAADEYGERTVGVVLTGANADGADGLRRIVDRGGHGIVQDPSTALSPTMPQAALREVPGARRLTLDAIGPVLRELVLGGAAARDDRAARAPGNATPSRAPGRRDEELHP